MNTKKFLLALLALFLLSPVMHSQKSVDQLFKEFAKEKEVTRVGVGKFTMSLAGLFTDVMGVREVEVLSFEECKQSVKEKLNKRIASLKDEDYETMVSVNNEKERTKILLKLKDETIEELIIMTSGDSPALIRIKGKIKPSDIENVINKNKPGKE
jgi:hypothetical protein